MTEVSQPEFYLWMLHTLFWIGILLAFLGLALIIAPAQVLGTARTLNRWISTKPFFDSLNRPRYQERYFYRNHRISGTIIVVLSAICLYILVFYHSPAAITAQLIRTMETEFGRWLIVSLYYLLLGCLGVALLVGVVVLIRPSLLKSLEQWGNRWVDTDRELEGFDRVHEIPGHILPGRPRWFGLFVLLGALYILFSTGRMLF